MEIVEVSPGVAAFVRLDEGANIGLIRTADGVVVVDTTSSPPDMQKLLDADGVSASEACLVINTHYHSDHTWGNQLFDCPILAHRLCREKMVANLAGPWSAEAIEASIIEGEKTDPDWAREARVKLADLRITEPKAVCLCEQCETRTEIEELVASCPACGSGQITYEGGQDLLLESIELDD